MLSIYAIQKFPKARKPQNSILFYNQVMENTEKIKHYIILALILIFGLVVRLSNLEKSTGGLWHDEATAYAIANALPDFNFNLHRFLIFPLYFIFYKLWITIFSNSDLVIRLMSVFFDMLAIITTYFVGMQITKNLKLENIKYRTGLIFALLYAINSSFIYYAQEAKFYSMTFFLITLTTLVFLKIIENFDRKSIIFFIISNALMLYTQTTLVVITILFTILAFLFAIRAKKLNIWFYFGNLLIYLPLAVFLFVEKNYFSGNFDIVHFDNSFILVMLQNWFSPVLTCLQNNMPNYKMLFMMFFISPKFWFSILFPIFFMITIFVLSLKNSKFLRILSIIPIFFVTFHIILSQTEFYSANVRYTLIVLPIVLMISGAYISQNFDKKSIKFFLTIFILANLSILFSPYSATKIQRPFGYKILADTLIKNEINPNYDFIMPFSEKLVEKYYKIDGHAESFYMLNAIDAQKTYLTDKEIEEISKKHSMIENYRRYLMSDEITKEFSDYVLTHYAKNSGNIVLIVDKGICMFSNENIQTILNNGGTVPIQFMRLSKLNNDLISVLKTKYKVQKHVLDGNWEVFVFEK